LLNLETAEAFPYSSAGYCVFSPDYAGLGFDTDSIITPYLIAEREPIAVIDGIRAVRQLASQIGLNLNGRLFLAGYSQGGHVCLATHKMMEAQYADEFRLTASAPGGAPADLSGTIANMLKSGLSGGTTFISFAVAAYQACYHLWHSFEEVFLPAYTNVPDLFYGGL
jgi:dienelactone hydrolase